MFFYGGVLDEADKKISDHVSSFIQNAGRYDAVYCTSGLALLNCLVLQGISARLKVYGPGHEVISHPIELIRTCLAEADMVILNSHEMSILVKRTGWSVARIADEPRNHCLIVTRGANGIDLWEHGRVVSIASVKVQSEIDATGAGDCFAGFFVGAYLSTDDLHFSTQIAASAASFVVESVGCQTNIPSLDEVINRYKMSFGTRLGGDARLSQ